MSGKSTRENDDIFLFILARTHAFQSIRMTTHMFWKARICRNDSVCQGRPIKMLVNESGFYRKTQFHIELPDKRKGGHDK